jgi:hypothetical protein
MKEEPSVLLCGVYNTYYAARENIDTLVKYLAIFHSDYTLIASTETHFCLAGIIIGLLELHQLLGSVGILKQTSLFTVSVVEQSKPYRSS